MMVVRTQVIAVAVMTEIILKIIQTEIILERSAYLAFHTGTISTFSFFSENKFYLNKCLNTLHNIVTEGGGNQLTSHGIRQLLLESCKLYS